MQGFTELDVINRYEDDVSRDKHTGSVYGSVVAKINPNSKIVLSAPHSVKYLHNGEIKAADVNTYGIAMLLHDMTGASVISLTGYSECDPHYDVTCLYKDILKHITNLTDIKLVVDLRGCEDRRPYFDICVTTDYGKSLLGHDDIKSLISCDENLIIENDTYFTASHCNVICNYAYSVLNVPAVELELSKTLRCTDKVGLLVRYLYRIAHSL